jgi:serine/threonine-protein kinase RsbW
VTEAFPQRVCRQPWLDSSFPDLNDVMESSSTIRLELDSRPAGLTLVRGMLSGLGEALSLDPELLDDLKTAISEACNNVVMHAYPDSLGPLLVELEIGPGEIDVTVRDHGSGMRHVAAADDRMGVGLAVISALAERAEFQTDPGGGTAVRMVFSAPDAAIDLPPRGSSDHGDLPLTGDVVAVVNPVSLLPGVLGRLARATAAAAHFTLDRFSDLYLIADELAAQAQLTAIGGAVGFALSAESGLLTLTLGPLALGSADGLRSGEGPRASGFPLGRLVDEVTVQLDPSGEFVSVVVRDRREPAASDGA